jgi:hypothetical protein
VTDRQVGPQCKRAQKFRERSTDARQRHASARFAGSEAVSRKIAGRDREALREQRHERAPRMGGRARAMDKQ